MMLLKEKLLVLVLTFIWLSGCATSTSSPPAPPEYCKLDYSTKVNMIRRVTLVADTEPPTIEAVDLGHTYGEGVTEGAAAGAAGGAYVAGGIATSPDSGPYGLLVGLLLLPVIVVGGAVGGAVVGTASGHTPDTLAEAEANAQAMLEPTIFQTEVLKRAQDYGNANIDLEFIEIPRLPLESRLDDQARVGLSAQSIDAVLEVELVRIKLDRVLEMEARSRLVSTSTNDVLSETRHTFRSDSYNLKEWTENGAAQLSEAIQQGLTMLAKDMIDESFFLFPRKRGEGKFAGTDPENLTNQDMILRKFSIAGTYGKLGSEFSSDLLNIPEGNSAIFIYRPMTFPASFLDLPASVPVIVNNTNLSILPKDGFDCVIVEPGMNTIAYPSKLTSSLGHPEKIAIVRESVETNSNEIAYFSISVSSGIVYAPVSFESVIEKEAVDSLSANRRAEMQVINQE